MRNLAPLAKFNKREKYPWRSLTFSKVAGYIYDGAFCGNR